MQFDLRQYILGVIHIDLGIGVEEIDSTVVDLILDEFRQRNIRPASGEVAVMYGKLCAPELATQPADARATDTSVHSGSTGDVRPPEPAIKKESVSRSWILPNAKMNEHYSAELMPSDTAGTSIVVNKITGLDHTGLTFDPITLRFEGIPLVQGELQFEAHYKLSDADHDKPWLSRTIHLFVNHDPRLLWNEVEPTSDSLFPKSHTAHGELSFGDRHVVAASKRGRSHARDGRFRDDDYTVVADETTGWLSITVSDGAGGSIYSREGSRIMCETIGRVLFSDDKAEGWKEINEKLALNDQAIGLHDIRSKFYYLIGNAIHAGYKSIEESAAEIGAAVKDFSCTLLLVLCRKVSTGWCFVGFWVGDGGLAICRRNEAPVLLGSPDSGEFSGQTRFITMPEILNNAEELFRRIQIHILEDFEAVVAMTDGITDAWFHTDANLNRREKWDEMWKDIMSNQPAGEKIHSPELLTWLDFWVKGEYDDRTIVILQ